jgi:hypothetical protein
MSDHQAYGCHETTGVARCERCGRSVGEERRQVSFSDRSAGVTTYRGRRLERSVCLPCAESLAEEFLRALPDLDNYRRRRVAGSDGALRVAN